MTDAAAANTHAGALRCLLGSVILMLPVGCVTEDGPDTSPVTLAIRHENIGDVRLGIWTNASRDGERVSGFAHEVAPGGSVEITLTLDHPDSIVVNVTWLWAPPPRSAPLGTQNPPPLRASIEDTVSTQPCRGGETINLGTRAMREPDRMPVVGEVGSSGTLRVTSNLASPCVAPRQGG